MSEQKAIEAINSAKAELTDEQIEKVADMAANKLLKKIEAAVKDFLPSFMQSIISDKNINVSTGNEADEISGEQMPGQEFSGNIYMQEINEMKGMLQNINTCIDTFSSKIDNIETDIKNIWDRVPRDNYFSELEKKIDGIAHQITSMEKPLSHDQLKTMLSDINRRILSDSNIVVNGQTITSEIESKINTVKNELQQRLSEAVAKQNEVVNSTVNTAINALPQKIKEIMPDYGVRLNGLETKLISFENQLGSLLEMKHLIEELPSKNLSKDDVKGLIDPVIGELSKQLKGELKTANDAIKGNRESIEKNTQSIKDNLDAINDLKNDQENELQRQLNAREIRVQELEEKNKELKSEKDKVALQLEKVEKAQRGIEEEKEKNQEALKELGSKLADVEKRYGVLESKLAPYMDTVQALRNCGIFADLAQQYGLSGEPLEAALACATHMGDNVDFVADLHKIAAKRKETDAKTMQQDEIAVYDAINKCLRQIWELDFDIFVQPGSQSVTSPYNVVKFDKNEASDLQNPKDTSRTYAQEVYVPMLRNREGKMYRQALVKAGNSQSPR